jgi:hypothetical protein
MSQTLVTLDDGQTEKSVIFANLSTNEVFARLVAPQLNEQDTVETFVRNRGVSLSVETPDSSNVERIVFNPVTDEVSFVFDNGSDSTYPSTFENFLEDIQAPSAGKQQWKYRRGER